MKKKIEKYIKLVENMKKSDFELFKNVLIDTKLSNDEIEIIKKYYATKGLNARITTVTKDTEKPIDILYMNIIKKIERVIHRQDILKKINGLKILLHGETGTGKTSLVNKLLKRNKEIKYKKLNFEEIISPKMGQTQINLFTKANELNLHKKPTIIFIDEIDSIVGNRLTEDLGERRKIVSSFIKFIDSLNENIIFIAATNFIKSLDDSIIRRFNFKIEGAKFGINEMIQFLDDEINTSFFRKKTKFNKHVIEKFKLSELNEFIRHYQIESEFNKKIDPYFEFMVMFKNKFVNIKQFDKDRYERMKNEL